MSWADDAPWAYRETRVDTKATPRVTSSFDEVMRRLLNAEATVSNLKQTVLKLCTELSAVKSGKTIVNPGPSHKEVQQLLKDYYKAEIMPEMLAKITSLQDRVEVLENQLKDKSPFDIKVLDY